MIACINAAGNSEHTMFIIPRFHFKETIMMHGAPEEAEGAAVQSGWINSDIFLQWLKHFIHHCKQSEDDKKLLILDNHETHLSYEAVSLAKRSGIVMLTMPPHTSHKLQPLDRSVFGPYKQFYNTAANEWMLSHPATPLTIYQVAELAGKAYPLAFTPKNIQSGFRVAGIWPLDENIFTEDEFLSSAVTDRANPIPNDVSIRDLSPESENHDNSQASTSTDIYKSPSKIRPFPKAGPRKTTAQRRRGSCRILTNTPEKNEIERLHLQKKAKAPKKAIGIARSTQVKRKILADELSSTSSNSDSNERTFTSSDSDSDTSDKIQNDVDINQDINQNTFCITKVAGKKTVHYYIAQIVQIDDNNDLKVKYLKRHNSTFKFVRANEETFDISKDDIVLMLPDPELSGSSARQKNMLSFSIDFSSLNFTIE